MRTNGFIEYPIAMDGSGFNEHGEPLPTVELWSEKLPCAITANTDNRLGRNLDGSFHIASYVAWVEGALIGGSFNPARIRLHKAGIDSVEREVIAVEYAATGGRLKIVV